MPITYLTDTEYATIKALTLGDFTTLDALTSADREQYFLTASMRIDARYHFKGYREKAKQLEKFPRINIGYGGTYENEIPTLLKQAVLLEALDVYTKNTNGSLISPTLDNVKKEKIGRTVEREYFSSSEMGSPNKSEIPLLETYLTPLLASSSNYLHRA